MNFLIVLALFFLTALNVCQELQTRNDTMPPDMGKKECVLRIAPRYYNLTALQQRGPFTFTDEKKPSWSYIISLCNPLDTPCGHFNYSGYFAQENFKGNNSFAVCTPLSTRAARDVDYAVIPAGRREKQDQFVVTFRTQSEGKGWFQREAARITRVVLVCNENQTEPLLEKINEGFMNKKMVYTFRMTSADVCNAEMKQKPEMGTMKPKTNETEKQDCYDQEEENWSDWFQPTTPKEEDDAEYKCPDEEECFPQPPMMPEEEPVVPQNQTEPVVPEPIVPPEENTTIIERPPIVPPGRNQTLPRPPIIPPGRNETLPRPPIIPPGRPNITEPIIPPENVTVAVPPIIPPGRNQTAPVPPIIPPGRNQTAPVPPIVPPGRPIINVNVTGPVVEPPVIDLNVTAPVVEPPVVDLNITEPSIGFRRFKQQEQPVVIVKQDEKPSKNATPIAEDKKVCWKTLNNFTYAAEGGRVHMSGVFVRDPENEMEKSNIICWLPEGFRPSKTIIIPTVVQFTPMSGRSRSRQRENTKFEPNMLMIYKDGRMLLANPKIDDAVYEDLDEETDWSGERRQRVAQFVSVEGANFGL